MQALCPNCQQRPQETQVDFDEVTRSRYGVSRSFARGTVRSFASTTTYGHTRLCARCAAGYQRMVRWRTLGWRIANRGFLVVMLGALFSLLVLETPALKGSLLVYFAGGVVLVAALAMIVDSILVIGSRIMRPSATRFLLSISPSDSSQITSRGASRQL
jgi:hypothetical protein